MPWPHHFSRVSHNQQKFKSISSFSSIFVLIFSSGEGKHAPMPTTVTVSGCNATSKLCHFDKKKPSTIDLGFVGKRNAFNLYASASITVWGGEWQVVMSGPACSKLTHGKCPVTRGGAYTYRETSLIPELPHVSTVNTLRIRVLDDQRETHACVNILNQFV